MSAFCIYTAEDFASVASDTAHTWAASGEKVLYAKKATFLPPKNMILASSGHTGFFWRYYQALSLGLDGESVAALNEACPALMRQTWEQFQREENVIEPEMGEGGTMLYQVGYLPDKGEFGGWRYYSGDGFEPKELPTMWAQPDREPAVEAIKQQRGLRSQVTAYFRAMKQVEGEKPPAERVGVGGTVWLYTLKPNAFGAEKLHTFE